MFTAAPENNYLDLKPPFEYAVLYVGQLQICQAVHPAVTELLGRASHLRMQDPSSFGLGSWHLQEKLLSPPVLTLPH